MEDRLTDRTPQRVLVVAAHADDIEFGCAGSVARWVRADADVVYCVVTDGAAGSNEPGADLDALVRLRREEQLAAARAVGVTDVRFLGYPDGILEPTLDVRRDIARVIRDVKPDRVVCQDPTTVFVRGSYINHPDHRAAGEAAIYAVFPSAETRPIFPELLDEGYEPHAVHDLYLMLTLEPDLVVDISDTVEQKIAALLCHKSQVGEDVADWIRERGDETGKAEGYAYAEAFRVMVLAEDEVQEAQKADLAKEHAADK
jgi:LmbE family N-acetylglucosaminyl deacetylase